MFENSNPVAISFLRCPRQYQTASNQFSFQAVTVPFHSLQAINEGLNKANQEVNTAQGEVAKAEALIAQECYEALSKAVE